MRRSFDGNYPITRPFGIVDPAYANYPHSAHPGTDYGVPANHPVVAGMNGTVTVYPRGPSPVGRGNEVVITSGNKQRKVCHLNRIDVSTGQSVTEGQQIGLCGWTGYVLPQNESGAHVHDELLIDGAYVPLEDHLMNGEEEHKTMTNTEFDTFIAESYYKIAERKPTDAEFALHRGEYAKQGDKWCLELVKGFKDGDWAWPKYKAELETAQAKIKELESSDANQKLIQIKEIVSK